MKVVKIIFKTILLVLIVFILVIPLTQYYSRSLIVEVKSIQSTITEARENAFEVELTGITQQVLEYNKRLDKIKKFSSKKILYLHFPKELNYIDNIK